MRPAIPILFLLAACSGADEHVHSLINGSGPAEASAYGPEVERAFATIRVATDAYHVLDSAVAAGYSGDIPKCYTDSLHTPTLGGMGFHHVNRSWMDAVLDLEKPEILLYERAADGGYAITGVEYILPYKYWPRDSTPPELMGRALFQENERNYWYTHVWVWKNNPAGLFADWNPDVGCPEV